MLANTAIAWRFHDADADIRCRRPIIQCNSQGELEQFVFNAHIADVPDLPVDALRQFYSVYQNLMIRIRQPRYLLQHALQPGEMVMFDNQRILHGREAFDPGSGERHFRGFYIDANEVDSTLRVLSR